MVAKKKYYKQKLLETQIKIIEALIEEEIEAYLHEQYDYDTGYSDISDTWGGGGYGGGGGHEGGESGWRRGFGRSSFLGNVGLFNVVSDLAAVAKRGAAELGTQAVSLGAQAIGGTIASLLPFNDSRAAVRFQNSIVRWEKHSVQHIEQYFARDMANIEAGWQTFKEDFWGIGFIASPFGVIAAAATGEKIIDATASVTNVITAGRVGAVVDYLTYGFMEDISHHVGYRGGHGFSHGHYGYGHHYDLYEATDEKSQKKKPEPKDFTAEKIKEAVEKTAGKQGSKNFLENLKDVDNKNEILKQIVLLTIKDPTAKQQEKTFVDKNLPTALEGIVRQFNQEASQGKFPMNPQELAKWKQNAGNMTEAILKDLIAKKPKLKNLDLTQAKPAIEEAKKEITAETASLKVPQPQVPQQPQVQQAAPPAPAPTPPPATVPQKK